MTGLRLIRTIDTRRDSSGATILPRQLVERHRAVEPTILLTLFLFLANVFIVAVGKQYMSDAQTERDTAESTTESEDQTDERTGQTRVCRATGREQGLIGKYDIWLCRQSFREMARDMGFRKYD